MVPGKLKFEEGSNVIKEAIFLRPKCYSIQFVSGGTKTGNRSVNEPLSHEQFRKALQVNNNEGYRPSARSIKKIGGFELFCVNVEKKGFVAFDVKRIWLSLNKSLPYGNYNISNPENNSREGGSDNSLSLPLKKRRIE